MGKDDSAGGRRRSGALLFPQHQPLSPSSDSAAGSRVGSRANSRSGSIAGVEGISPRKRSSASVVTLFAAANFVPLKEGQWSGPTDTNCASS